MKRGHLVAAAIAAISFSAAAQDAPKPQAKAFDELGTESGVAVFEKHCTSCHGNPDTRAPDPSTLRQLPPEHIVEALTTGLMKVQGAAISDEMKKRVAEYLSGRPLGAADEGATKAMANRCAQAKPMTDPAQGPGWNGWGGGLANTRFAAAASAGLSEGQIPKLRLKWAFGFPRGVSAYSQPTIASGRVFTGSDIGFVYALDAATGCSYWAFEAKSGVRSAVTVGPVTGHPGTRFAAFFGDGKANVYAVDAETGALLWTVKIDDHFTARITAGIRFYEGKLYVPVSGSEEFTASAPAYPCCTFRGSIVALDAATGKQLWKSYVIPETPHPTRKNEAGIQLFAPAGGAIWDTPTIDPKHKALYVGTGDSETEPAAKQADAVWALDLATGKTLWSYQTAVDDSYVGGCSGPTKTAACPSKLGGDLDIGNSPILATLPNGHRVVIVGTKDAKLLAVDPDKNGALVWQKTVADRPGKSGLWGVEFGGASDGKDVYYPLTASGLIAVKLATGDKDWFAELSPAADKASYTAAASAAPGAVFVGGSDGKLYAVSTKDGRHLWEFDTAIRFDTVNGVPGHGGSMGGPGPVVAGGMVFVGSGYSVVTGTAGNVLLAFAPGN